MIFERKKINVDTTVGGFDTAFNSKTKKPTDRLPVRQTDKANLKKNTQTLFIVNRVIRNSIIYFYFLSFYSFFLRCNGRAIVKLEIRTWVV